MFWIKYQKRKKIYLALILIIATVLSIFFLRPASRRQISIGNCSFRVELADSSAKHYRGLSNRKKILDNHGMLFIFNEASDRSFVMREMNFPLDIIFIRDGRVINIYHNAKPEGGEPAISYESGSPADSVLEIAAGQAQLCKIAIGSLMQKE